ncbi:MAG: hypothetical protein ACXWQO_15795 [Bdellovibrionota bacterium]
MKNFLLVLAFFALSTAAKAENGLAGRQRGAPAGACTTDVNHWGHPSACACGVGHKYDQKIGKCR